MLVLLESKIGFEGSLPVGPVSPPQDLEKDRPKEPPGTLCFALTLT